MEFLLWWLSLCCSQTDQLVIDLIRKKVAKFKVEGGRLEMHEWKVIRKLARNDELLRLRTLSISQGREWINEGISLQDQTELVDLSR